MAEHEISAEARRKAEAEGETGYGTSYPMRNCAEVEDAIRAYGRAPEDRRAELRRAIARRHVELGCTHPLPASWRIRRG